MAGGRAVQAAHEGQERALAAARRADDGDVLARPHVERHVVQGGDVHLVAPAELAGHRVQSESDGLAQQVAELVMHRGGMGRLGIRGRLGGGLGRFED